jgi:hypothetical protein
MGICPRTFTGKRRRAGLRIRPVLSQTSLSAISFGGIFGQIPVRGGATFDKSFDKRGPYTLRPFKTKETILFGPAGLSFFFFYVHHMTAVLSLI